MKKFTSRVFAATALIIGFGVVATEHKAEQARADNINKTYSIVEECYNIGEYTDEIAEGYFSLLESAHSGVGLPTFNFATERDNICHHIYQQFEAYKATQGA